MRLRLGSGFGIPVYIHATFFLLPLWILAQPLLAGADDADAVRQMLPLAFTVVPLVFACVLLHEFGHALMARYFGIPTHDITLYPIGGVARLERMTEKPLEEFLIAVAGPAVNVLIASLLLVPLIPLAMFNLDFLLDDFWGKVLLTLFLVNVIMVPFNLLPAFPMDGGRVLRAFLSATMGHYAGTQLAVAVGVGMAILFGIFGVLVFKSVMLPIIAVFIFFAGQQELFACKVREQQRRLVDQEEPLQVLPVRAVAAAVPTLPPLLLQPTISVYTWDSETGAWRREPGSAPATR